MRVLVVDDSSFMRRAIATILNADPDIEVVATGQNGKEAVELAKKHKPDVITLDIEMPEMDGLTALRHIMRECPTQVLMVSSLTTEGSEASLKALKLGAADFLAKDHSSFSLNVVRELQDALRDTVKVLGRSKRFTHLRNPGRPAPAASPSTNKLSLSGAQIQLVCIGSSTGGPPVLEAILENLPVSMTQSVVVAQHMPQVFTKSMAKRLNTLTGPEVLHIEQGMRLEHGKIYIAPGGQHTHLREKMGTLTFDINQEPAGDLYKPSVSALFESVAKSSLSRKSLNVVLTGIGEDGLRGAKALKAAGGKLVAQDEASCVVYGMPKAVTQANLVDASMSPKQIHELIAQIVGGAKANAA